MRRLREQDVRYRQAHIVLRADGPNDAIMAILTKAEAEDTEVTDWRIFEVTASSDTSAEALADGVAASYPHYRTVYIDRLGAAVYHAVCTLMKER
jgi:NADH:ubiquinone oxidoreductase subunit E